LSYFCDGHSAGLLARGNIHAGVRDIFARRRLGRLAVHCVRVRGVVFRVHSKHCRDFKQDKQRMRGGNEGVLDPVHDFGWLLGRLVCCWLAECEEAVVIGLAECEEVFLHFS